MLASREVALGFGKDFEALLSGGEEMTLNEKSEKESALFVARE